MVYVHEPEVLAEGITRPFVLEWSKWRAELADMLSLTCLGC